MCYGFSREIRQKRDDVDNLARLTGASRAQKESIAVLRHWIRSEIEELHKTVTMLQSRSRESIGMAGLSVLVTESAANILRAHLAMWEAFDDIESHLA